MFVKNINLFYFSVKLSVSGYTLLGVWFNVYHDLIRNLQMKLKPEADLAPVWVGPRGASPCPSCGGRWRSGWGRRCSRSRQAVCRSRSACCWKIRGDRYGVCYVFKWIVSHRGIYTYVFVVIKMCLSMILFVLFRASTLITSSCSQFKIRKKIIIHYFTMVNTSVSWERILQRRRCSKNWYHAKCKNHTESHRRLSHHTLLRYTALCMGCTGRKYCGCRRWRNL